MRTRRFIGTKEIARIWDFPTLAALYEFLRRRPDAPVVRRGAKLLVEEREFELWMIGLSKRGLQRRGRLAKLARQASHQRNPISDVHSEESTETSAGLHLKPFEVRS